MDEGLKRLADYVCTHYGLNFRHKLASLELKTKARLAELNCTYLEYCNKLSHDASERALLVELLTVHETYFFREDNHIRELCAIVELAGSHAMWTASFHIWSAACSTGEEPYSIAMMLHEKLGSASRHIRIVGTDIDAKTLTTAASALYFKKSFTFRRIPKKYLDRYFIDEGEAYRIKPEIRQMVSFHQLNLLDESAVSKFGDMDAIFCRNVLIYFDPKAKDQVIQSLHRNLKPHGHLFLGHAESVQLPKAFETVRAPGTFYYRKEGMNHASL